MKTQTIIIRVWIAVGVLVFGQDAFAANPNLSIYKGKYTGPVTLTAPEDSPQGGRATVIFAVPTNGKSARINYRATVAGSAFPTVISLAANKRASVTDLLVGIAGTNNAKPGRGQWSQRKRTLQINATNGEGIRLRGTAVARDFRNRRELTLRLVSTDPGGSYVFAAKLRSRLP